MRLFKLTLTLIFVFFYSFTLFGVEEPKITIKGNTNMSIKKLSFLLLRIIMICQMKN